MKKLIALLLLLALMLSVCGCSLLGRVVKADPEDIFDDLLEGDFGYAAEEFADYGEDFMDSIAEFFDP